MIDASILARLQPITAEEQVLLDGSSSIDRDIYMTGTTNVINSKKLLADGKLITLRPHTRFIHFPEHTHDYVEVIYSCMGQTTHIVNGRQIRLKEGELLFLGQSARHEVCKASATDITVNFIVLPEFFNEPLSAIQEDASPLRRFILDCLLGQNQGNSYLYFQTAEDISIQNLIENLILVLLEKKHNRRNISQTTMSLLLLELLNYTGKLWQPPRESVILTVLRYIETHYADGSLTEVAKMLHLDIATLSREIHRQTGKTYTGLVQEKRLTQAAFLLRTTDWNIDDIAVAVGYENISYFHRLFRSTYGISPRNYRVRK